MSPPNAKPERNAEMVARRAAGETYASIARAYGISPPHVRDIVLRMQRHAAAAANAARVRARTADPKTIPIRALDLPVRVRNGLLNAGCETVGDALKRSDDELLCPNFGKVSLADWHRCLAALFPDRPAPYTKPKRKVIVLLPLVVPRINLNGNSAPDLVRQLAEILNAITKVKATMAEAGDVVHGRNFQTFDDPIGTRDLADAAWLERRRMIEVLHEEVRDLALGIQEQGER